MSKRATVWMLFLAALLMLLCGCQPPHHHGGRWQPDPYGHDGGGGPGGLNLLVMGVDDDPSSIRRSQPAFDSVLNAFASALQNRGFAVFDETALTLDTHRQGRVRRSDHELIDIAKSLRNPPIDVVVLFSVYPITDRRANTMRYSVRVGGRLLDVQSGRRLGNYSYRPSDFRNIRPGASRRELNDKVLELAVYSAEEVADVVAAKLSRQARPRHRGYRDRDSGYVRTYQVVLRGFHSGDASDLERYLMDMPGYRGLRTARATGVQYDYSYSSTLDEAAIRRNLVDGLDVLGLRGRIYVEGNRITVRAVR